MLRTDDLRRWVDRFRTSELQVRRDHLISHVLLALPRVCPDVTFFGGTALCRTHLLDWRLSEDVDLLADRPGSTARDLGQGLPRALRKEYPGSSVDWTREGETYVGSVLYEDVVVRIQLVERDASYRRYPTAPIPVRLRYVDLPAHVRLACPTPVGAAAMKLSAWVDRAAPRDLCDLYGLVRAGTLDGRALAVAADAARRVQPHHFADGRRPSAHAWRAALDHQMAELPDVVAVFDAVAEAVRVAAGGR